MDARLYTKSKLEELVLELSGLKEITPIISKHISRFVIENKMTYLEIARCVDYYVEILGHEIKPEYGLSFVLNVREAAGEYFRKLELDKQKQQQEAKKVIEYQDNNIIINIKSYKKINQKKAPKKIDIGAIKIDDEQS